MSKTQGMTRYSLPFKIVIESQSAARVSFIWELRNECT